ncbi:hypothetical protein G8770_05780 [Aestuariicella hydrocarbonica]|uniref:Uncharacterized protein n=1 Tax=Pseudomaricurvus hydrocarbonicus TaxID=1470433 RepID=A0A9E5MJF6_9GAMM|nr:hypothetical protein [Aestuariicella hydrocarbonica]NHO65049.1 hypothetical protein [Aestuariicella hydrocarbonica]
MIVFTATNIQTQDVYVGTARESVEEEWADLLSQADNGTSGQFFEQLRAQGSDGFEVDTWAYGESPAEARESMREARDDLGAQPIKSSRGKAAGRSTGAIQSASMKALMAAFEEAVSDDSDVDVDDLDGIDVRSERRSGSESAETEAGAPAADAKVSEAVSKDSVRGQATASPQAEAQHEPRQRPETDSRADGDKMNARLAAMKAAQERLLRERPTKSSTPAIGAKPTAAKAAGAKPAAPVKMATGRTGSAAKEKRIREAIEAERERRENLRHTNNRDEQTEMNVVMARIEMRRQATKKANAEKAKQSAAARRAKQKAADNAAAEAAGNRMSSRRKPAAEPAVKASAEKPAVATMSATQAAAKAGVSDADSSQAAKLAAGRTGSSLKEKRIKEAIEREKAERLARQQEQRAAEAQEMAAILARLEERTREAERMKRKR